MRLVKIGAWLGAGFMAFALVYGFATGDFFQDGSELLNNPWGIVSLVDLYTGFALFSLWILYREKSLWRRIIWITGMMTLGFFTGSLYVIYALYESRGDKMAFWMGTGAED